MKKWELQAVSDGIYYHLDEIINRISELEIEDEKLNLILETANGFAIATALMIVGSENKRLVAAAKQPRKSNHEETRAMLIAFRDAYIERHGKERGWKTAAINDIDIDVSNHKAIDKLIGTD